LATASPFDAALRDVLDRLHAASTELEGARDATEVAKRAADLALTLTHSAQAVVALGALGVELERPARFVARGTEVVGPPAQDEVAELLAAAGLLRPVAGAPTGRRLGNVIGAPLQTNGEVVGGVAVTRPAEYSETERLALEVFAAQVAMALAGSRALEDLRKSVERLTKVDAARQLLLKNMTTVVERERKRFVAELHDDAMQKLTAAEMQLARVGEKPDGEEAAEALAKVRELLDQTEASLRRLVFDVRPPALENPDGLAQSIRDRVAMVTRAGISPLIELDLPADMSLDMRTMLFRQVAEAVGNAERHSEATQVTVSLKSVDGGVHGVISDNGHGFAVAERTNLPGHLGLLALRERALMAGGRYSIESRPGSGTRVEFWIPLDR